MRFRYLLFVAAITIFQLQMSGCGGESRLPIGNGNQPQPPATSELPQLPSGPEETRLASTFDGVAAPGNPAFSSVNATPDGANLLLESGEALIDLTAWAIYQLPESPGDPIDMLSVSVQYLDPDPVVNRPEEGYWVAYADYASNTWIFSGPHSMLQTRVSIPPAADAVSPGGFHYLLVLVCQNNQALVQGVAIGGYDGFGYEEHVLGLPPGHAVGYWCDIQLDPAGIPQIAYLDQPILTSDEGSRLRVAKQNGDSWEIEPVAPSIEPRWFSLALGDDGRRALLISDRNSGDLWLYYDNNTGEFSDAQLISNAYENGVKGSATFANSADNAALPLDMVVVVYAKLAAPDITTFSRTYDGLILTPDNPVFPGPTDKVARLAVTTNADKLAMVGVPDKNGGNWSCAVGTYSAGLWNFLAVPAWGPLDNFEESDDYVPDTVIRESPTGDLVGCYMRTDRNTVRMGRYNGVSWLSEEQDILAASVRDYIDIGAFGSGRTVILMNYADMKPMLRWGLAGSGETYGQEFLEAGSYAAVSDSLAVDSANNVHIAAYSGFTGELHYYVRPPSGPVVRETVDAGGMQFSGTRLIAEPAFDGHSLHAFYPDNAHPGVLHSENADGIWNIENEVIENTGLPFITIGSGYLEDLNLLYIFYLDYFDLRYNLLTGTPDGDDWQRQPFGAAYGEYIIVADDETNIGVIGVSPNPITDARVQFFLGQPRSDPPLEETVSLDVSIFDIRSGLAFNPFDGTWGFVSTFDENNDVVYFRRNGPSDWTGPYTVAHQSGPGALMRAGGLTYLESDGAARVVVLERASGDPEIQTNVYTAPAGDTSFSFLLKVKGVQDAVSSMPYATVIPGAGGEPVIGIVHKLIAESTYDVDLFVPDGPGSWTLHETWDSPLTNFYPRLVLAQDGQPAVVGIENDNASPIFGSVVVYYPW